MKKRLVIVSHVFAPSNHPNAKRPYLMAKYLVRKGWDVTVFTTSFQMRGAVAKDVDGIRVECIPSLPVFISEHFLKAPAVREKLLQLCQGILFPDLFAPWMHKVARRLKKMDYDCGILNVLPYASFLLTQDGVLDSRWIIDYQESVYPYLEQRQRTSPLQKFYTPKLLALERKSLLLCGRVWFTSRTNQARYVADHAVDLLKTDHLPYFYDPDLYPEPTLPVSNDVMTVLYGGNLDSSWRSPETFFKAWAAFFMQFPESSDKVRMVLYGSMDKGCWQMAEACGVRDKIEMHNPIPYQDFLRETKRADALLYIDAREQGLFNPGKLADYFGAGRPVLGFTALGSEVEEMLKSTGMSPFVAAINDIEAGTACLSRLWSVFRQKGGQMKLSSSRYSAVLVCDQADQILQKLIETSVGTHI